MGPPVRDDNHPGEGWLTRENALALLLVVGSAVIFTLCLALASPFLPGVVFGLALALLLRRPHARLKGRFSENTSAGLATVLGMLLIVLPTWFVINQLVVEGTEYAKQMVQSSKAGDLDRSMEQSRLGPVVRWLGKSVDLRAEAVKLLGKVPGRIPEVLTLTLWMGGQFILTLIVAFYLLRDRRHLLGALRHLVPLSDREYDEMKRRLADSIHATVLGTLAMGVIQGVLGGLAFWGLGLPAPLMWAAIMGVLSIIPMLGAFLVWVPASIALLAQGETMSGIALALWGLFAIGAIDNILYPVVVGSKLRMHSLLVLVSLLGGIALFGTVGLVIGPMILSISDVLVEVWRRRTLDGHAAEEGVNG